MAARVTRARTGPEDMAELGGGGVELMGTEGEGTSADGEGASVGAGTGEVPARGRGENCELF